jgi:hypothetical protein
MNSFLATPPGHGQLAELADALAEDAEIILMRDHPRGWEELDFLTQSGWDGCEGDRYAVRGCRWSCGFWTFG